MFPSQANMMIIIIPIGLIVRIFLCCVRECEDCKKKNKNTSEERMLTEDDEYDSEEESA